MSVVLTREPEGRSWSLCCRRGGGGGGRERLEDWGQPRYEWREMETWRSSRAR